MYFYQSWPSESRIAMLRLLAYGAGEDDIVLILHMDRKDHLVMNYAQKFDRLPIKEQESLALMVTILFQNTNIFKVFFYKRLCFKLYILKPCYQILLDEQIFNYTVTHISYLINTENASKWLFYIEKEITSDLFKLKFIHFSNPLWTRLILIYFFNLFEIQRLPVGETQKKHLVD